MRPPALSGLRGESNRAWGWRGGGGGAGVVALRSRRGAMRPSGLRVVARVSEAQPGPDATGMHERGQDRLTRMSGIHRFHGGDTAGTLVAWCAIAAIG